MATAHTEVVEEADAVAQKEILGITLAQEEAAEVAAVEGEKEVR